MTRMFQALKKANGDLARVALPLIDSAGGVRTEDVDEIQEQTVVPVPPPMEQPIRTVAVLVAEGSPFMIGKAISCAASEQYRIIRTRVLQHDRETKMLLVSSATPGDGKTVTAINVGAVHALRHSNVLLIDSDLRRPSFAKTLGIPNSPGLGDVLSGACPLQDAIVRTEQNPNLHILTAGQNSRNPAELLDSGMWRTLCETVRAHFDFVVLDAPPVAAVADYELLQASCDSVLLVVRPNHTNKSMFARAAAQVPDTKLLGVVVNCAFDWMLWKRQHAYGY